MHPANELFPVMPIEVLEGNEALHVAERALDEGDESWVPITPAFAEELCTEWPIAATANNVAAIPKANRCFPETLCYCVLQAPIDSWRAHGLLRIMSWRQFQHWAHQPQ
ncbi:MAG: hypothetical protein WAU70_07840 [Flavobacteriales bacterium]